MIASAFGVTHAPAILAAPDRAGKEEAARFYAAYDEAAARLAASEPDAVVLVTAEHFTNFFHVVPPFHLHNGDYAEGPVEDDLGIEKRRVPGSPHLANQLLEAAADTGVDLSFGPTLKLDHGSMIPLHLLRVNFDLPVLTMLVNCLVEPYPRYERCRVMGEALKRFAERTEMRIAMIAAGGLSHWPAMPESGRISEAWDRAVLDGLKNGNADVLITPPSVGEAEKGPGAEELRAWTIVGTAALRGAADVLAYEPISGWSTGCAVVDLLPIHDQ